MSLDRDMVLRTIRTGADPNAVCGFAVNAIVRGLPEGVRAEFCAALAGRGLKPDELFAVAEERIREEQRKSPARNGKPREDGSKELEVADARPRIYAGDADLGEIVDAAWAAIVEHNSPPRLFRFGLSVAGIGETDTGEPIIRMLTADALREVMARSGHWFKVRERAGKKVEYDAKPPLDVARVMLASDLTKLPGLNRIIRAPIMAPSGRIVEREGYDEETRTYLLPGSLRVPEVSARPNAQEIRAAVNLFEEFLCDFPFLEEADRANAVALLLLPSAREIIDGPTPLHLIEKPAPGSGAGLMLEALGLIARGCSPTTLTEGTSEDEWRKRITSTLLSGPDIVVIDNLRHRLDSAALSSVLTARTWTDRRLGASENVVVPVRCVWAATGNNPAVSSEIARRSIPIRIDPKVDRPWERTKFRHPNLLKWTRENRGRLIHAALTLLRAWDLDGRPEGQESLGSYERWAAVIGGVLSVAGVEKFLGNRERFYDRADRESAAWRTFVGDWFDKFQHAAVGVKDLCEGIEVPFDLGRGSERSQRIRLGEALARNVDRRFTLEKRAFKIECAGKVARAAQYRLVELGADAPESEAGK